MLKALPCCPGTMHRTPLNGPPDIVVMQARPEHHLCWDWLQVLTLCFCCLPWLVRRPLLRFSSPTCEQQSLRALPMPVEAGCRGRLHAPADQSSGGCGRMLAVDACTPEQQNARHCLDEGFI